MRVGATEVAGVYHHTSRHLGDRPKVLASRNLLGVQVAHARTSSVSDWQVRARAARTTVNGSSTTPPSSMGDARYRRVPTPGRTAPAVGRASGIVRTIDRRLSARASQRGGRLEGAVRFIGRGAGMEFNTGVEQRIEADAIEARPTRWAFLGFRVESLDWGR